MLTEDRDALTCDMAETYGIYDMRALPVATLATLACGLREDSRIKMRLAGMDYIPSFIALIRIHDLLSQVFHNSESSTPPTLLADIAVKREKQESFGFDTAEEFERARARFIKN